MTKQSLRGSAKIYPVKGPTHLKHLLSTIETSHLVRTEARVLDKLITIGAESGDMADAKRDARRLQAHVDELLKLLNKIPTRTNSEEA